jgi:hypothetical protein
VLKRLASELPYDASWLEADTYRDDKSDLIAYGAAWNIATQVFDLIVEQHGTVPDGFFSAAEEEIDTSICAVEIIENGVIEGLVNQMMHAGLDPTILRRMFTLPRIRAALDRQLP